MEYKDYYKTLGLAKDAAPADIKKKYRKLAVKYHPDKNEGDAAAEQKFKEINEAYEVLGDPEKRKKYDELGENWKHYERYQQAGQPGANSGQQAYAGDFEDFFGSRGGFSDFFNSFFGGAAFGSAGQRSGRSRGASPFGRGEGKPPASEATLPLSFEEALHGVRKMVSINDKKIRLNIKPGARDGQKLNLHGHGSGGGDLLITLQVAASKEYVLEGRDLIKEVRIPLYTAVLGGKAEVSTPYGKVSVPVAAGTQTGRKLRIKGKGMPEYGGEKKGDLILRLSVQVPTALSAEERQLFERLQNLAAR